MSGGDKKEATEQEKALAEIGAKQWNRFSEKYAPMIEQAAEDTRAKDSDIKGLGAQASGAVAADTRSLEPGGRQQGTTLQAHGQGAEMAAHTGTTQAAGRGELKHRELRGLLSAAALGRGVQDQGTRGIEESGYRASQRAGAQQMQGMRFRQGLISAAAMGVGAYGQHKGWFDAPEVPAPKTPHSGHRNTVT